MTTRSLRVPEAAPRGVLSAAVEPPAALQPESVHPADVLRMAQIDVESIHRLLDAFDLNFVLVADGQSIPGSYWGECEAGIIGSTVHARGDTPVHSLLHEACHLIVLPPQRRAMVHTDATDSIAEEDAACYLQIVLAERLPGVGAERIMRDMDTWGYSFRLGSARAWFENDAEDARSWLLAHGQLA
jgi:hypothetical protein